MPTVKTGALAVFSPHHAWGEMSKDAQTRAAEQASQAQIAAGDRGIAEQRYQFDQSQKMMQPFVEQGFGARADLSPYLQQGLNSMNALGGFQNAGMGQIGNLQQYVQQGMGQNQNLNNFAQAGQEGLSMQRALSGGMGPDAQKAAIAQIEQGPQMQAMIQQGENAMLQNASATGGLRGGNTQAALAQFRPQMLNQLVNQQYGRAGDMAQMGGNYSSQMSGQGANLAQYLAGAGGNVASQFAQGGQNAYMDMMRMGQASAAGQAAGAQSLGGNVADLMGQQGAAVAGANIARGQAQSNMFGQLGNLGGQYMGYMGYNSDGSSG